MRVMVDAPSRGDRFPSTRWSLVRSAGDGSERALEALCRAYWFPLYGYARGRRYSHEDAQDLVQGFFAMFVSRNDFAVADDARGRFRAYILVAMKNYMASQHTKQRAQKRGGGAKHLSFDWDDAAVRYQRQPEKDSSPESAFARSWALTVMARATDRLAERYQAGGRSELFERIKCVLSDGELDAPMKQVSKELGISEGALKVAVHRLRTRFGVALREEVADTLDDPTQLDDEIRDLLAALE
jgi:RNA polymerase sigma-70 factor (ECF subfamily)